MVLWSRLRQSRSKFHAFSNGSRRFHNLNPAPVLANQQIVSRKLVPILNYPKSIVQEEQLVLFRQVRFFAKAVKVQKVERDENDYRLNEEITAPMVRLIMDEGHCIIPLHEALARARKLDMDLVEVSKNAKPPVVKIYDYNKQKYIQQTKEKERSKSKVKLKTGSGKEVIFRGKIKDYDLKVKADMVIRLMEKGYRVKCSAADNAEGVDLKGLLSRFTALIEDVAVMECEPKYEKKQAYVVVRHIKYGPLKSGGKKASVSASADSDSHESTEDPIVADSPTKISSDWTSVDNDDGEDPIFEIEDGETGQQLESSMEKETSYSDPRPASNTMYSKPNFPNQTARGISKQDSPDPTPPKTYGIFSTSKVNGTTNTTNTLPTFPNQGRFGNNTSPQASPGAPARAIPKQDSQPPTPSQSFGIFSALKAGATNASPISPNLGRPGNNISPQRRPEAPARGGIPKQDGATPPKPFSISGTPKVNGASPLFPNQGRPGNTASPQPTEPSARGIPKQDSSGSTPPKSYGIFSAPKVNPADPRMKGGVGGENPGQPKYGIFSGGDKENPAQRR